MSQANTNTRTAPPASPVATYLSTACPGLSEDGRYVVLPRVVLEHLPPALQQQLTAALGEVHRGTAGYSWPQAYRVTAVRWRPIGELVEGELREIGVDASLDTDGELVHRDSTGRRLTGVDLATQVPVPCPDPWYPSRQQAADRVEPSVLAVPQ